ncbi:MAG: glycosyltransferase family 2 protein [Pseudomonadota bacterium]
MQNARDGRGEDILASIILLTKNGEKHLRSVLDGLYRQRIAAAAEVIVIDSGSADATLEIVSAYPARLTRIRPEEFGHGRTRNLGARLARGRFLVYLPQDATPVGEDWLRALLAPFEDPAVAGVYGRQVPRPEASAMEQFFLLRTYPAQPEMRALGRGEDASLARCFFSTVGGAIRASLWRRHPFDESVIMSEDQAWARDVMLAGHAIAYQPAAELLHSHDYGIASVFRRNFDSGYSIRQIFSGRTGISLRQGVRSLAQEAVFVLREGVFADALRFPLYEGARHLGFWLGMHAERLPVRLRKACGNLGYFWDRTPRSQA